MVLYCTLTFLGHLGVYGGIEVLCIQRLHAVTIWLLAERLMLSCRQWANTCETNRTSTMQSLARETNLGFASLGTILTSQLWYSIVVSAGPPSHAVTHELCSMYNSP